MQRGDGSKVYNLGRIQTMAKLSARIRQGTTPALEIRLFDEAVQDMTVYVTIDQSDVQITKSSYHDNPDIMMEPVFDDMMQQIATDITVIYSQAETLRLRPGHGKVQVRWIDETETADGSAIGRIEIAKSLLKGVITYG